MTALVRIEKQWNSVESSEDKASFESKVAQYKAHADKLQQALTTKANLTMDEWAEAYNL